MAPPVTIPAKPEGAKGVQFAGFTSIPPTTRKVRMAPILIRTMMLLVSAGFLHAAHQQQSENEDDEEAGEIEIGARPLPSGPDRTRPFFRQVEAEHSQLRFGITGKAHRDRDVRDGVFEDEVPSDDPGENLAERGVGIGVGAASDGNHRGQFGVAQSGKAAGDGDQQK